tara:strand:- start:34681 stop:34965 length:285 start_codon:yes stop_codon:yes gene_type:complete
MCNVTIAKAKLQRLKVRTEKDLYGLEYDSMNFIPLTRDTYFTVKMLCNENDLKCPLYRYGGVIKFKENEPSLYSVLRKLAKEFNIYLDYTEIPQ